jgi:hypothetical protein
MEAWALLKLNPVSQDKYVRCIHEWFPRVETYFPIYSRVVRVRGSRQGVKVIRPVYPGYIFIRVDQGGVYGVTRLPVRAWWVKFGGIVETVPGSVITTIKRYEQDNQLVREEQYVNPYRSGTRVRVRVDVVDLVATVVRLVQGGRALVDLPVGNCVVPISRLEIV